MATRENCVIDEPDRAEGIRDLTTAIEILTMMRDRLRDAGHADDYDARCFGITYTSPSGELIACDVDLDHNPYRYVHYPIRTIKVGFYG